MTDFPDLKFKAVVQFPAKVLDGTGIDIVKSNGSYQFNLDFGDFAPPVGSISDVTHQNALLWNSVIGSYTLAPITLFTSAINVKNFGAIGDGVTDDTSAIESALYSRVSGETLYFPPGTYKITRTLYIGNGNTTTASTTWGIHLAGSGRPPLPATMFAGYPSTGCTKLLWAGGASPMIQVTGPLNGWGVSNIYLDGANVATIGISNISGSFGNSENLSIDKCLVGIYETTQTTFSGGWGTWSAIHNSYTNLAIMVPAIAGATGIVLTGRPNVNPLLATNSCYAYFQNVVIEQPPTLNTFGIYLQWTDTATFDGVHLISGSATSTGVMFDYTLQDNMPSSCQFYSLEASGSGTSTQYANSGTPGSGARPNYVNGIAEINLGANPNLANFSPALPRQHGVKNLTGQTSAITASPLFTPFETGIYRVAYYITVTTGGSAGTYTFTVNFNDTFGAKTLSSTAINATGVPPSFTGGVAVFKASAGQPITFTVTLTGISGSPVYAVSVATERVG